MLNKGGNRYHLALHRAGVRVLRQVHLFQIAIHGLVERWIGQLDRDEPNGVIWREHVQHQDSGGNP